MLLLGEKTEDTKELFKIAKELSILHLFVISGFHIGLIYKTLTYILDKTKIHNSDIFALLPIILYVFLLN